jgi:hypothetical protein
MKPRSPRGNRLSRRARRRDTIAQAEQQVPWFPHPPPAGCVVAAGAGDSVARGTVGATSAPSVGTLGSGTGASPAGCSAGAETGTVSMIEVGSRELLTSQASPMLVTKNAAARTPVVRVSRLAVPRPLISPPMPPPPPMPRPPPSLFCSSTAPTSATAIIRWMTRRTFCMAHAFWSRPRRCRAPRPLESVSLRHSWPDGVRRDGLSAPRIGAGPDAAGI